MPLHGSSAATRSYVEVDTNTPPDLTTYAIFACQDPKFCDEPIMLGVYEFESPEAAAEGFGEAFGPAKGIHLAIVPHAELRWFSPAEGQG